MKRDEKSWKELERDEKRWKEMRRDTSGTTGEDEKMRRQLKSRYAR